MSALCRYSLNIHASSPFSKLQIARQEPSERNTTSGVLLTPVRATRVPDGEMLMSDGGKLLHAEAMNEDTFTAIDARAGAELGGLTSLANSWAILMRK